MEIPSFYSGLLSSDEMDQMKRQSLYSGLLNFGQALAESSAPSLTPRSTLSGVSRGLSGFNQGYQGQIDTTLQNLLKGSQVKQMLDKQKQEKEQRERIAQAYTTKPVGTGLTMTGEGSQQQMLLDQIQDFGQEGARSTLGALQSNVNLPREQTIDFNKLVQAIAITDPVEAAKLMVPKEGKEKFEIMTTEQKQALGLPTNRAYQISTTGKVAEIGSGPQAVVNLPPAETEKQKGYGKFGVEQNTKIFESGQSAVKNIGKINETLKLIEDGSPTTGLGAEIINNINRTKLVFSNSKQDIKNVSDTELLNSLLGADVFPQIGALGIGAKGLDTPAEREFLRQVMTGTITMNKDTILRLTKLRKKYEEKSLDQYNNAVEEGQLDDLFNFSGLPKRKLTVPKSIQVNY
jgi:hypothetical protein